VKDGRKKGLTERHKKIEIHTPLIGSFNGKKIAIAENTPSVAIRAIRGSILMAQKLQASVFPIMQYFIGDEKMALLSEKPQYWPFEIRKAPFAKSLKTNYEIEI